MKTTLLFLMILSGIMFADWVDFGIDGVDHATISVIESTPSSMVLEITIPGVGITPAPEDGVNFSILNIPGGTITALEPGYPQLPKVSFLAALPSNPSVTCTVESMETIDLGQITPYPMQPIMPENAMKLAPFTYVPAAYETGIYPSEIVQSTVDGILRGVTIGRFAVNPVVWDAETGELTAYSKLRVRIEFGGSVTVDRRLYSRFFEPTFNQSLINADILGEPVRTVYVQTNGPVYARTPEEALDLDGADLLIMAGDDFVDTFIDEFVTAKFEQGYLPAVVSAGTWTYTEIADYIQNAYDTWELPPSFVLTIGDGYELTAYNSPTGIWSDNRYACVDGGDYMADIFHGRFATPTDSYPNIQDKQMRWQFDPVMNPDFWGNVLCAGALEVSGTTSTRWFLFTCESVHDTYEDIYGKTAHRMYTTNATAPPPYYYNSHLPSAGTQVPLEITYTGTSAGIVDVINDGVFLVQHRAHGSVTGWGSPPFYISHLAYLTNTEETPAVFSFNCSTGKFYDETCFAECMARMVGGAVMVVAACGTSYSYFNDYMIYGCYRSFNDDFISPPALYTTPDGGYLAGQMMTAGKLEMQASAPFNPYGGSWEAYAEDEWDLFLVFGDPTMDMRTEIPSELTVSAPLNLSAGATQATFTVSMPDKGLVEGALVCLRKEDENLYATGLTDASGMVTLTFDALVAATEMKWTVTAHNALREEGFINGVGISGDTGAIRVSIGTPFPNPCYSMIQFPVSLESAGDFELTIFDLSGRVIDTVHSGELEAGFHELVWDGRSNGTQAPTGVYMARYVIAGRTTGIHKVILLK